MYGTTFGAGNGTTTFNLPDFRGRTPIGAGQGTGLTNRTTGSKGGTETHALTEAELAPHTHLDSNDVGGGAAIVGGGSATAAAGGDFFVVTGPVGNLNIGSAGSGAAHPNMQPWLAVNFIVRIK
jgi:microcystin-dependent protein